MASLKAHSEDYTLHLVISPPANAAFYRFQLPRKLIEIANDAGFEIEIFHDPMPPTSAESASDLETENAWERETRERVRAVEEGHVIGVAYGDVMRAAEERLAP